MQLAKIKAVLAELPELAEKELATSGVLECAICLAAFADDQTRPATRLPCSRFHVVHVECMARWVDSGGSSCPLCKWLLLSTKDDDIDSPVMA